MLTHAVRGSSSPADCMLQRWKPQPWFPGRGPKVTLPSLLLGALLTSGAWTQEPAFGRAGKSEFPSRGPLGTEAPP